MVRKMTKTQKAISETTSKWKEAILGICVAVMLIMALDSLNRFIRERVSADNFFEVSRIYVPDFAVGENPKMIYDYQIKEDFHGFYYVEIFNLRDDGRMILVCRGNGSKLYKTNTIIRDPKQTDLDWYANNECSKYLTEGRYQIFTSWIIMLDDYPSKTTFKISNVFEVTPN
jgi:hypothetical protein